jgi:hypothetical protein
VIHHFLASVLLIDLPFVLAILLFGWRHPVQTVEAWYSWRAAHSWTFLLSVPAAGLLARRWWMR